MGNQRDNLPDEVEPPIVVDEKYKDKTLTDDEGYIPGVPGRPVDPDFDPRNPPTDRPLTPLEQREIYAVKRIDEQREKNLARKARKRRKTWSKRLNDIKKKKRAERGEKVYKQSKKRRAATLRGVKKYNARKKAEAEAAARAAGKNPERVIGPHQRKTATKSVKTVKKLQASRQAAPKQRVEAMTTKDFVAQAKKKAPGPPVNSAERELALRELCRKRLVASVLRFNPDYMAGWVHKVMCQALEQFLQDVLEGKSPRLMIQMPPRTGKSQLASIDFPAWALGKYPWLQFISCSYSGSLANEFSVKTRARLRDSEFQAVFRKCKLDKDNQNTEGWKTTQDGGYTPAGVGGAITGKGAHILTIDDPVKNSDDAESDVIRKSTMLWYKSTAYTRLAPGGGVLVIQTRWHDDDLSGALEREMVDGKGDTWKILRFQALADEDETYRLKGEALHPERYNEQALKQIRDAVGPRVWSALYQQNPVVDEGAYFTMDMFERNYYDERDLPDEEDMRNYDAWDPAISKKETADYTVGFVGSYARDGTLYIRDVVRRRMDSFEIVQSVAATHARYNTFMTGIEKGVISTALGPLFEQHISRNKQWSLRIEPLPPGKSDKPARARTMQGLMAAGRVKWPRHAPWLSQVMHEMLRFPYGVNDDVVDAAAWLAKMISDMIAPVEPREVKPKSFRDELDKYVKMGLVKGGHMSA